MKYQLSFSDLEYATKKKVTHRDRFLAEIEGITPWKLLVSEIKPYYHVGGKQGRQPIGLEGMLRMYIAQQCFGLSMVNVTQRCIRPKKVISGTLA